MKNEQIMATPAETTGSVTPDIYLFKLNSGKYENEYTKNCGLLGQEIDQNFHFLNGMDITGFTVESEEKYDEEEKLIGKDNILSIALRNGNNYTVNLSEEVSQYKFSYNPETGTLTIVKPDGSVQKITGFLIEGQDFKVVTDGTIDGTGTKLDPLSINPTLMTGVYAPVKKFVDLTISGGPKTIDEYLQQHPEFVKARHLRFLTKEAVDSFGYLYTYKGAKEVVREIGNGWRIPTKYDWDCMLNGMEKKYEARCSGFTCESSHFSNVEGAELGCKAGQMLRSGDLWNASGIPGTNDFYFSALPVGTADNDRKSSWFNENSFSYETKFWTDTKKENSDEAVWLKSLTYNKTTVGQETEKILHEMYSLRLVKDDIWDGIDVEVMCGVNIHCGNIPYIDEDGNQGTRLWTIQNIAIPLDGEFAKESYHPSEWDELSAEHNYRNVQPSYFVAEWDGYHWRKRQMADGEAVIILDTDGIEPSGTTINDDKKEYDEYRVEWNESAQTYSLVNTLAAFRKEMMDITDSLTKRTEALESCAHTHDNKALLDAISEERVENWDTAFERASAITEQIRVNVGLNEEYKPIFKVFKYNEVEDITEVVDPVIMPSVIEKPTETDPKYIGVGVAPNYVYYRKDIVTGIINSANTVVDAIQKLDVDYTKYKKDAETISERIIDIAVNSAKTYTDEQIAIVSGVCENLDTKINATKEELNTKIDVSVSGLNIQLAIEAAEREDIDKSLQAQIISNRILRSDTIITAKTESGTRLNVLLPAYDKNAYAPEHINADANGLYFDGFFGIIPSTIPSGGSITTYDMVRWTIKKHKDLVASGITEEDYDNAYETEVNPSNKSAYLKFTISPVGVANYTEMTPSQQEAAREEVCYDLIFFTNNAVEDILPNDMTTVGELGKWVISRYSARGKNASYRYDNRQCVIYDPNDVPVIVPDELELNYTIKFR